MRSCSRMVTLLSDLFNAGAMVPVRSQSGECADDGRPYRSSINARTAAIVFSSSAILRMMAAEGSPGCRAASSIKACWASLRRRATMGGRRRGRPSDHVRAGRPKSRQMIAGRQLSASERHYGWNAPASFRTALLLRKGDTSKASSGSWLRRSRSGARSCTAISRLALRYRCPPGRFLPRLGPHLQCGLPFSTFAASLKFS